MSEGKRKITLAEAVLIGAVFLMGIALAIYALYGYHTSDKKHDLTLMKKIERGFSSSFEEGAESFGSLVDLLPQSSSGHFVLSEEGKAEIVSDEELSLLGGECIGENCRILVSYREKSGEVIGYSSALFEDIKSLQTLEYTGRISLLSLGFEREFASFLLAEKSEGCAYLVGGKCVGYESGEEEQISSYGEVKKLFVVDEFNASSLSLVRQCTALTCLTVYDEGAYRIGEQAIYLKQSNLLEYVFPFVKNFTEEYTLFRNGCFSHAAALVSANLAYTGTGVESVFSSRIPSTLVSLRFTSALFPIVKGDTFLSCSSLRSLFFCSEIEEIEQNAFDPCPLLEEIVFAPETKSVVFRASCGKKVKLYLPLAATYSGILSSESFKIVQFNGYDYRLFVV